MHATSCRTQLMLTCIAYQHECLNAQVQSIYDIAKHVHL